MNKVDINVTEATPARITIDVGDEITDHNDNKFKVLYIDFHCLNVVVNDRVIAFDAIASGEYQRVVGDQIVLIFLLLLLQIMSDTDINDVKMPRESISVVKATISLGVGDKIVDNLGNIFEVAYIDYAGENIIVVPDDDTVSGNRASVLTFCIVACNYQKVTGQKV